MKLVHTGWIDPRRFILRNQAGHEIADVIQVVGNRAVQLPAQSKVEREVAAGVEIVLQEASKSVNPVFVVGDAAATAADHGKSTKKILKVRTVADGTERAGIGRARGRSRREHDQPVEQLREGLVQVDAIDLASKTHLVSAPAVTDCVEHGKIVL